MIKTTHPMNSEFIKLSCTAILDSNIKKIEKTYEDYNKNLYKICSKLPQNILYSFFTEGPELLSIHDINVKDLEIGEESIKFDISGFFHSQDKLAVGSLLFTGVSDIKAEFDDSPVTMDYLIELMHNRNLLEVYFDILPNKTYSVDIYSLNEEPFEDGKDDDDFQILHLQFNFQGYSADLEAIAPDIESNENIDAMDTYYTKK